MSLHVIIARSHQSNSLYVILLCKSVILVTSGAYSGWVPRTFNLRFFLHNHDSDVVHCI